LKLILLIATVLTAPTLRGANQVPNVLQVARQEIEQGDYGKAEIILREYVAKHDKDALGCYLLGVALSLLDKREQSNTFLQNALRLDNSLFLALRFLGVNAYEAADLSGAKRYLRRYVQQVPGDEVAYVTLAQVAIQEKDFPAAIVNFRRAKILVQGDAHLQLLLAQALVGANEVEEGRKIALGIRSEDPEVTFQSGVVLASAKSYEEAIQKFTVILQSYPNRADVKFNLALTYFQSGNDMMAIRLLQQMIEAKQADADVYSLLGDVYIRQRKIPAAREALETAVDLEPQNVRHYLDLLALYIETEEIGTGLKMANFALGRHPKIAMLYAMRAILYSLENQITLAEADYRKALQLSPKTEQFYTGLATLLAFDDDRLQEARNLLGKHVEEFTGYYSLYFYADVLRRLGLDRSQPDRQIIQRLLEQSVHLNPTFAPSRLNLGRIHSAERDWAGAIAQFEAAIAADPGDKRPYYELYQIYQRTGDPEKGRQMLTTVKKINEAEAGKTPHDNVRERVQALKYAAQSGRTP
jgi:tetratricopeptide (TPR) repeat protein